MVRAPVQGRDSMSSRNMSVCDDHGVALQGKDSTTPILTVNQTGYDLGSHSLDANFKAQRTAALRSVKTSVWPSFYACLEREGDRLIANLAEQGGYGTRAINPLPYMQVVAMALGWSITFDKEFAANDPWLREYIDNACLITKVRGASNTWSDFVPFLRLHPKFRAMGAEGEKASKRRTAMIQEVLENLKSRIAAGETPTCVAAQVMMDETSNLSLCKSLHAERDGIHRRVAKD